MIERRMRGVRAIHEPYRAPAPLEYLRYSVEVGADDKHMRKRWLARPI